MSRLINSFQYAGAGLLHSIRKEKNFQIHSVVAVLVVAAGWFFSLASIEWMVIVICIGLVLGLELLNTAVEQLCNMVQPGFSPLVKIIKDVSAAAVIVVVLMAVTCGAIIFVPKILSI